MQKKDRLAAGYTLEKYERIYRQAFYDAAKKADPNWEIGKPIKAGALDDVTRETKVISYIELTDGIKVMEGSLMKIEAIS